MINLIPSWYAPNSWTEKEISWYVKRERTEFDDTVKQVQLFHRNGGIPYRILLLSHAPNFRHFLHRQGVFNAPYWSLFDAIQSVGHRRVRVLSFHDLKWPKNVEFIYSPFAIVAKYRNEKYAQIDFGEDGNMVRVDLFKNDIIIRRNNYDDRGFVSSSIVYEEGKEKYADYLMENGRWKMRVFKNGTVQINPSFSYYSFFENGEEEKVFFCKKEYSSLEEVILEVLQNYSDRLSRDEVYCTAVDDWHIKVVLDGLAKKKLIFSFFGNRYQNINQQITEQIIESADHILTDSEENSEWIKSIVDCKNKKVQDITPYDSRVNQGISSQVMYQKILVPIDGLNDSDFEQLIVQLAEFVTSRERVLVHVFTRRSEWYLGNQILEKMQNILNKYGFNPYLARAEKATVSELNVDEEELPGIRFYVNQCVDELSMSKCIRQMRIVADMRTSPDLYLQISSISVGIPLIVRNQTRYTHNGKNSAIIKSIEEVNQYLSFYLDELKEWNKVQVYDYELSKQYTSKVLVEMWKEVIDTIG